jgi:hypothetical protein
MASACLRHGILTRNRPAGILQTQLTAVIGLKRAIFLFGLLWGILPLWIWRPAFFVSARITSTWTHHFDLLDHFDGL